MIHSIHSLYVSLIHRLISYFSLFPFPPSLSNKHIIPFYSTPSLSSHSPLFLLNPIASLVINRSLRIRSHHVLKATPRSLPSPLQQPIIHAIVHILRLQLLSADSAPQIIQIVHHASARLLFSNVLPIPTRSFSSRISFRRPSSIQSTCRFSQPRLTFCRSKSSRLRRWFDKCALYYFWNSKNPSYFHFVSNEHAAVIAGEAVALFEVEEVASPFALQRFSIFFPVEIEMHRTDVRICGDRPDLRLRNIVPLVLFELVEEDVAHVFEMALNGLFVSEKRADLRRGLCVRANPS